ncbi:MAG: D-alanyl-D-alanine carboxypeptidase [Firmicutes bacterium]|nr:D-alanyl-D-alanine carboxypeptidase [Bacillota bacterium]
MHRKWILALFAVFFLQAAAAAGLAPLPELSSAAYLAYDADFRYVIAQKNANQRRSIASMTKVMTLLYTIELVEKSQLSLEDTVIASSRAAGREGTQIKLKRGDRFSLEELLYATALVSANDAAVAIAEHIAGSEANFTRLMNQRALELGLKDTYYADCTGLLSIFSNNYSTAYDQAKLFQLALEHALFRQIISTPEYYLAAQDRKIVNSHPLLEMEGVEGGKTGATTPAGHTLITSRMYRGRRLITVILGARTRDVRNQESEQLLEWACTNLRVVIPQDEPITSVLVPDGVEHEIDAVLGRDFSVFAAAASDLDFKSEIELSTTIRAPIDRGDKVGELVLRRQGQEFTRLDLVAGQSTGLASWLRRIFNGLFRLIGGLGR